MELVKTEDIGLMSIISGLGGISIDKPFSKEVLLTNTHVAGTSYITNIHEIASALQKDTKLQLFREQQNKFDKMAVLIKDCSGNKLGYVPRYKNDMIAHLMDAGKLIYAKIDSKQETGSNYIEIRINIYLKD